MERLGVPGKKAHPCSRLQKAMLTKLGAELALELIADKWFVQVMAELRHGALRYNELRRAIPQVSQRMLTRTLRNMERDGFLERSVSEGMPLRTEYRLTPLGVTLLEPLRVLCLWANEHYAEVASRRLRDNRHTAAEQLIRS
jgi:DNA-binding HxlR family transcriptional regulator